MWKSQQNFDSLPLSQNVCRQDVIIIKCADIRRNIGDLFLDL